ncbi:MAG: class I SAM-dependent methyltransferase [Reichenbachiella sp.]
MTCEHCCGADQIFDLQTAQKEMRKFKKRGPGLSTQKLITTIKPHIEGRESLLDIGGGIGAIQWAFLGTNGKRTTDVDSSSGYLQVASEYATENNLNSKFISGDFNDLVPEIETHDVVTLDKVVCCYPDYEQLLKNATRKTRNVLAMTLPLGGFISNILRMFSTLYFKFRKNAFRTYIHNPKKVQSFIESQGFQIMEKTISFPWLIRVYQRIESN